MPPRIELEVDYFVWKDSSGAEQVTQAACYATGTVALFQQSSAPVGWTKATDQNNKALRVVTGTPTTGGNVAFSTVFGRTSTSGHTLSESQMPSHAHSNSFTGGAAQNSNSKLQGRINSGHVTNPWTSYSGSSQSHSHSFDTRIQYVDCIYATKD